MKTRPIIFSGASVRGILAGRKTQTRRVVDPRNSYFDGGSWPQDVKDFLVKDWANAWVDDGPSPAGNPGPYLHLPIPELETTHRIYPRFQPGDRLWVREVWTDVYGDLYYRADGEIDPDKGDDQRTRRPGWKSPIHMPKKFSRLTLEITALRIERLQEISAEDIVAEGPGMPVSETGHIFYTLATKPKPHADYVRNPEPDKWTEEDFLQAYFGHAWDALNARRGFSWESNPWVWVISFQTLPGSGQKSSTPSNSPSPTSD